MALTYDIRTDVRYQQGIEKGKQEGKEESKEEMVIAMLRSRLLTNKQIAQVADISPEQVLRIKKKYAVL